MYELIKKPAKKRLRNECIHYLALSWIVFIGLFIILAVEAKLEEPWIKVTNSLWFMGVIIFIFLIIKGFNKLYQYWRMK